MNEEDEEFNEIERQAGQRKEAVRRSMSLEEARQQIQAMTQDRSTLLSINPYRDLVIEEVAQHVEKLKGFDNINELATCIRELQNRRENELLYTAPPQRKWIDLTDKEIIDVLHPLVMADMPDEATDYEIARAIEAKLKEKNT